MAATESTQMHCNKVHQQERCTPNARNNAQRAPLISRSLSGRIPQPASARVRRQKE
jgi:hypothetical protein